MSEFGASVETVETVEFRVDFEQSGHDGVDAALDRLLELPGRELAEHAGVYDDIHQRLRGVLAEQPAGPDGAAPGTPGAHPGQSGQPGQPGQPGRPGQLAHPGHQAR